MYRELTIYSECSKTIGVPSFSFSYHYAYPKTTVLHWLILVLRCLMIVSLGEPNCLISVWKRLRAISQQLDKGVWNLSQLPLFDGLVDVFDLSFFRAMWSPTWKPETGFHVSYLWMIDNCVANKHQLYETFCQSVILKVIIIMITQICRLILAS